MWVVGNKKRSKIDDLMVTCLFCGKIIFIRKNLDKNAPICFECLVSHKDILPNFKL